MKSLIFLSLMILFLFPASLLGQDHIILETGEEIECKIVEVSTMEVKYMLYAQNDGHVITVPRLNVRHIEYQDITKNAADGEESAPRATLHLIALRAYSISNSN